MEREADPVHRRLGERRCFGRGVIARARVDLVVLEGAALEAQAVHAVQCSHAVARYALPHPHDTIHHASTHCSQLEVRQVHAGGELVQQRTVLLQATTKLVRRGGAGERLATLWDVEVVVGVDVEDRQRSLCIGCGPEPLFKRVAVVVANEDAPVRIAGTSLNGRPEQPGSGHSPALGRGDVSRSLANTALFLPAQTGSWVTNDTHVGYI